MTAHLAFACAFLAATLLAANAVLSPLVSLGGWLS